MEKSYQVVLQRGSRDIETLYWSGSLEETTRLARLVALQWNAEKLLIFKLDGSGAGLICGEQRPFGDHEPHSTD